MRYFIKGFEKQASGTRSLLRKLIPQLAKHDAERVFGRALGAREKKWRDMFSHPDERAKAQAMIESVLRRKSKLPELLGESVSVAGPRLDELTVATDRGRHGFFR